MLFKYKKFMTLILFMGYLYGVQSKECYSCEGINCLRTSKIADKATCTDSVDSCVTVFEECMLILVKYEDIQKLLYIFFLLF